MTLGGHSLGGLALSEKTGLVSHWHAHRVFELLDPSGRDWSQVTWSLRGVPSLVWWTGLSLHFHSPSEVMGTSLSHRAASVSQH